MSFAIMLAFGGVLVSLVQNVMELQAQGHFVSGI
jgi:type III secretory pathway component EscS